MDVKECNSDPYIFNVITLMESSSKLRILKTLSAASSNSIRKQTVMIVYAKKIYIGTHRTVRGNIVLMISWGITGCCQWLPDSFKPHPQPTKISELLHIVGNTMSQTFC
jgi:hypothetical protein